MANSVAPDEKAHDAVSSGSALFAKVYVLFCWDERVKIIASNELLHLKLD